MKATELRIGNLLSHKDYPGQEFEVVGLTKNNCQIDSGLVHGYFEWKSIEKDILPILLTKEWMVRFGFEIDGDQQTDNIEFQHPDNTDFDLMFSCSVNKLWCAYNFGKEETNIRTEIVSLPICNPFKYVHQLQNLYFALTGEELTIK